MLVVSWNVNGLRAAARKGFLEWMESCGADVVAVQEVRAQHDQLPESLVAPPGWHTHVVCAERKGYSGLALYSRYPIDEVADGLGEPRFDAEARYQQARIGQLRLVNVYVPNGNGRDRDNSRIPYKLDFSRRVFEELELARAAGEPVLVMGDMNTAPYEIDLARPKQNVTTSGFTPPERNELVRWLENGWTDTFRHFEPGEGHYTWWSQRKGVRQRNIGWRLDLILASGGAMPYVKDAHIWADVYGSDHCPVAVDLDPAVTG